LAALIPSPNGFRQPEKRSCLKLPPQQLPRLRFGLVCWEKVTILFILKAHAEFL